jgi:sugar lactone lactonase YvrE
MGRRTQRLLKGLYFGEGPRWHEGRLWFSDFHAHAVKSVSLAGDLRTEVEIDDRPSGLGWMPDGSMLIVSMTKRCVLRQTQDGEMHVHADLSGVAAFPCNDMIVDSTGRAFVGNFGFDIDAALFTRGNQGVIDEHETAKLACVSPAGVVSVAAEDMHFPNGSVISPDNKTLIVGESLGARLTAFDIGADDSLTRRREWANTWPRVPDGITLDAEGAIWIANPFAPECVRIAEGGEVFEIIETGHPCFACMLGGPEGRTLFMLVAPSSVAHIAAASPLGEMLITTVDAPHAGLP